MKYKPYSFSKIKTFQQCPQKFNWQYINKIDIDKNFVDPSFFVRGRFIHQFIANKLSGGDGNINGFTDLLTHDKLDLINHADQMLENEYLQYTFNLEHTKVEKRIKLSDTLLPTNKNHLFVGAIDYFAVEDDFATIIDWKSGKYRDNPSFDQLELYAIWIIETYPKVDEIDLCFFYIEEEKFIINTITRELVIKFKEKLLLEIQEIENTQIFTINPTGGCKYCAFIDTCIEKYNDIRVINLKQ